LSSGSMMIDFLFNAFNISFPISTLILCMPFNDYLQTIRATRYTLGIYHGIMISNSGMFCT
jgi:hypothetical protein